MTTLLIDGNNLLMRAIFAAQRGSGMSADGVLTGPLVIFINSLSKHISMSQPERVAVAWDGGRSHERIKLSADYKANRVGAPDGEDEVRQSTFQLAKQFLTLANINHLQLHGREADDLIAAWWANENPGTQSMIEILSSDKDFLQLIGTNPHGVPVEQIRLSSADTPTDRWTADRLLREHRLKPEDWASVTALTGDKSDNVIGVPKIGPVRAVKLLEAHSWDLKAAAATLPDHTERIMINYQLVSLREPALRLAPIPAFRPTQLGSVLYEDLVQFLDRYKLATIRDRLGAQRLWSVVADRVLGRQFSPKGT